MRSRPGSQPELQFYAGLMSGTSLDAVDAVVVAFDEMGKLSLCGRASTLYTSLLRKEILALQTSGHDELHRAAQLANRLADLYADVLLKACANGRVKPRDIVAAGVHGQTIRHRPECHYSLQLNQPARIAERTGITMVADFRSRDIAAHGQGAPLVPAFHAYAFNSIQPRAVLNLGGIANLTLLNSPQGVLGFDTGPGNMLMDAWIQRHQSHPFDRDGAWAASGCVNQALLQTLLAEPYFNAEIPKSTGRDLFNIAWLQNKLQATVGLLAADVQATLLALTAQTICDTLQIHQPETTEVIVCGGGAYNVTLLKQLQTLQPQRQWQRSDVYGFSPELVEPMAFAWLARQTMQGLPGNLPTVTGAAGARILGAIYQA